MTYILGVTGLNSENPAAALLKDGRLIAAAEEERFNRIKHSRGKPFPEQAINFCLNFENITLKDVERIGVGWASPKRHLAREVNLAIKRPFQFFYVYRFLKDYRRLNSNQFYKDKRVHYNLHHLSHASSCFHVSGFKDANILNVDGRGEATSTMLCVGKDYKDIKIVKEYSLLNSLGAMYEAFTDYLGFLRHSQEGKVMGLASYGRPVHDVNDIVKFTKEGYSFETLERYKFALRNIMNVLNGRKVDSIITMLEHKFGPRRLKDEPIMKRHEDIAATIQNIHEKVILKLAKYMFERTGIKNFCLAGGSNLNCIANGALLDQEFVKDIYIQPAASDGGTAIGAAFLEWAKLGNKSNFIMDHAYWGPFYSEEYIEKVLKESKLKYGYYKDISGTAAELIAKNKIVGWFQGRMEIGPRALGNRSMLSNPKSLEMRDRTNKAKRRELWRPLAPSMIEEAAKDYLENPYPTPFMLLSTRVKRDRWNEIPAVVHIDGTTRAQTVNKKVNPKYHKLISDFGKITGTPIVLNTSFNDKAEPIACSPQDAVKTFFNNEMDYLAIENFLIKK